MPFIPFFTNTNDFTPDFDKVWFRYGNQTSHSKREAQREYYKAVRNNRVMMGDSTMEETEMRTLGYGEYVTSKRPKLRKRSSYSDIRNKYKSSRNSDREDNLDDRINQIRKGTGSYAPSKGVKRKRPYLDQEAQRRNVLNKTDSQTGGSGVGINIIIAFVGMAIMLMIGMLIFSEVDMAMDQRNMNSTSGYPVTQIDPFEMMLEPFYQIKDRLGALVGLDDFPMWALLPLIIGIIMVVVKMFGTITARGEY